MKSKLKCKKDWTLDGITHFKKDEYYYGHLKKDYIRKGIDTFIVKDKYGIKANFHTGSDYFDI